MTIRIEEQITWMFQKKFTALPKAIFIISMMLVVMLGGCKKLIPDVDINLAINAETRRTIENVNKTIADINNTIGNGIEIGPETRATIENLITEIENFNNTGVFGNEGIETIRYLTEVVDNGLEVGLDDATIAVVSEIGSVIDNQPGKWGEQAKILVRLMGLVGTDLADEIAEDLVYLSAQVSNDIARVTQQAGIEGKCIVDYVDRRVENTVETAGGKFIASILPALKDFYESQEDPTNVPGICTILPVNLKAEWRNGELVADENSLLLEVSGFNFSNANLPEVTIQTEDEEIYSEIILSPSRESSYKFVVPLQGINFSNVAPRSRIVFSWKSELIEPVQKIILVEDALVLEPDFSVTPQIGQAPLNVRFYDQSLGEPTSWFWEFGDGTYSELPNPIHTYEEPGTYAVKLTLENEFSYSPVTIEKESIITVRAAPTATPTFTPEPTITLTPSVTPTWTSTPLPLCQTNSIRFEPTRQFTTVTDFLGNEITVPLKHFRWLLDEDDQISGDMDLHGHTLVEVNIELFYTGEKVFLRRYVDFQEVNSDGEQDGDKTRFSRGPINTPIWENTSSSWVITRITTNDGELVTNINRLYGDNQHNVHNYSNPTGPVIDLRIYADSEGDDEPRVLFDLEPITIHLTQVEGCR